MKLRLGNGQKDISKIMVHWTKKYNVHIQYIQPGKVAQNTYIERFNRTYREEVLVMYLFRDIKKVQVITDKWMTEYNNEKPHESLGNLTPRTFRQHQAISNITS